MQVPNKLHEIATIIHKDRSPVYYGALPYLDAMGDRQSVNDNYGADTGRSVVNYFLANARTWRGETAKAVKAKLNELVKQ
ncbi:hypothetical protein [Paraflavitalea pollutisoli]|uniref:hypothetical protein n=1 Tax=Paraflavitalea pollutisoli TaxID=3034143 RepID=UPI0023EDC038|nr:hypothetical protein [Paraflavitalea sp. H1-2-19X]